MAGRPFSLQLRLDYHDSNDLCELGVSDGGEEQAKTAHGEGT